MNRKRLLPVLLAAPASRLATDPHFESVVLLVGFNGADGATTTTDESSAARALTFAGNAQIDTAQQKFGTSSLLLDGTGDYVTAADSADWDLSDANSDQFTIDLFVRFNALAASTEYDILGQFNTTGNQRAWLIFRNTSRKWAFLLSNSGSASDVSISTTEEPVTEQWYWVEVSKNSAGKIRLRVDGVMLASATPADSTIFGSTALLAIGARSNGSTAVNGWIDEVRITKGVCRNDTDSNVLVPTEAFPRL